MFCLSGGQEFSRAEGGMRMKQKIVIATFAIVGILLGNNCAKNKTLSDELVGVWKTSTFQYKDTYVELQKGRIIFKTIEGDIDIHPITKVEKEEFAKDEWILYTIYYVNRDLQKVEFPFYYHALNKGRIIFKNQTNVVWRKETG